MSSQQHPHVTFSVRYRESFLPTLNAITALQRADELADEVDELISLEKIADNDPNSERRPKRLELISYVAVGLVTCLEWHARSRFIDLLAHYPEEISESVRRTEWQIGGEQLQLLRQSAAGHLTISAVSQHAPAVRSSARGR